MDTATINHVSLCSGYGGIDLGLSRAMGRSLRTIAYSEIEAFACANLVSKMEAGLLDSAPIWSDLKSFPWEEFRGLVDIISGGYPCQPFSAAGKRAGKDDPRHLWPWIADGIAVCRPRLVFLENVEGHISLGLSTVISDLEELGYRTTWGVFSAAEVGAPHQRKRVFILAERSGQRGEAGFSGSLPWEEGLAGITDNCGREGLSQVADTGSDGHNRRPLQDGVRGWRLSQLPQPQQGGHSKIRSPTERCGDVWPSRPGEPQHGWEPPRVVVDAKDRRQFCDSTPSAEVGRRATQLSVSDGEGVSDERGKLDNASGNGHGKNDPVSTRRESAVDAGNVGNADGSRQQERERERGSAIQGTYTDGGAATKRQAEPALGGNPHGSADRLDYAELYVTCDNRTDELRLLGNGVVPATAERAFLTLLSELAS